MMDYVLLSIVALSICWTGVTGQGVQAWNDPVFVEQECRRSGCQYPDLCYIPHPTNCFKFIMCQGLETGQVMAQAMSCGFGTMWKAGTDPACDRHDLVECMSDLCRDPAVTAYAHEDDNCRTFWKCQNGKSEPSCCNKYHAFNSVTGKCVPDIKCDTSCPLVNDATCKGPNAQYANVDDGNCRTFWDCENGHPHPVCCPRGQGFDVFKATCVLDPNCLQDCPKDYSASCAVVGTLSYDLVDKNCRTYMKCNSMGQADPYCCLPGLMYNAGIKQCVDAVGKDCVNAECPRGFLEGQLCQFEEVPNDPRYYTIPKSPLGPLVMLCSTGTVFNQTQCMCAQHYQKCRLEAVPGKPNRYKNLDSYGGFEMPCPVGTVFNPAQCNCFPDPNVKPANPRLGCSLDIDAHLPDLKNYGTAVAALLMIGEYGQGETGVGNMSAYWDGGAGLNIPFYGSQSFRKMYLETRFNPTAASRNKQVLLSSCQYLEGVPSLELTLSQFHGSGGILTLLAKNSDVNFAGVVEVEFPYLFNQDYILRVIFDGSNMGVFLDNQDPNLSNSEVQPFKGEIQVHRSGLRFTHCRYETDVSGFIGYVKEIKFTRCLTREMNEALNDILSLSPAP
ncbi:hypothetical protein ACF0H5_018186 [Mactra antiquata]